jgi:c-di-GMP-binding flagellar brake protein YcgR
MKWNEIIERRLFSAQDTCQLIIVGETKDGQPFCYEDSFLMEQTREKQCLASLTFHAVNPLEQLNRVMFVEFSFRDKGILYYSFVQLLHFETRGNHCIISFIPPETMSTYQNRRFSRILMPARNPVSCRIVGVRRQQTHDGVPFVGQMLDVSGGGLSFITPIRLFYPLVLELSFRLPPYPDQFVLLGEVTRVAHFSTDSYRVAVEFRQAPESVIQRIDQYCSEGSH